MLENGKVNAHRGEGCCYGVLYLSTLPLFPRGRARTTTPERQNRTYRMVAWLTLPIEVQSAI